MQDLIDGLGISRSSLYDTYGDKRTLYLAALKKYHNDDAKSLLNQINNSDSSLKQPNLFSRK
jgi:TetR/AcrR family transcriptional regulator, transcriptional repressor for nem operon